MGLGYCVYKQANCRYQISECEHLTWIVDVDTQTVDWNLSSMQAIYQHAGAASVDDGLLAEPNCKGAYRS